MPKVEAFRILSDNYCFFIENEQGNILVDPGEAEAVFTFLQERNLPLKHVLLTHKHADHIGGVCPLQKCYGVKVYAPENESIPFEGIQKLKAGPFDLAGLHFELIDVPGHTKGHGAYYLEAAKALFCGDALFSMGCGRLFEGTAEEMFESLQRLKALPDETLVYCGHEYTATNLRFASEMDPGNSELEAFRKELEAKLERGEGSIPANLGLEKRLNPFLRAETVEDFADLREKRNHY